MQGTSLLLPIDKTTEAQDIFRVIGANVRNNEVAKTGVRDIVRGGLEEETDELSAVEPTVGGVSKNGLGRTLRGLGCDELEEETHHGGCLW